MITAVFWKNYLSHKVCTFQNVFVFYPTLIFTVAFQSTNVTFVISQDEVNSHKKGLFLIIGITVKLHLQRIKISLW